MVSVAGWFCCLFLLAYVCVLFGSFCGGVGAMYNTAQGGGYTCLLFFAAASGDVLGVVVFVSDFIFNVSGKRCYCSV